MAQIEKQNKRTTAKKAKKVSSVSQWKAGKTTELEVPSGNVCLVRKPDGMKAFMVNGKIPNSLMPMVTKALDPEDKDQGQIDMTSIANDPESVNDLLAMVDSITLATVVEPKLRPVPLQAGRTAEGEPTMEPVPLGERDEGDFLYVDEIDLEDKLVIMAFATGGIKDLEQFRKETTANVATLVDVSELSDSTLIDAGSEPPV